MNTPIVNEAITNNIYPVIKGGTVMGRIHLANRINKQDNIVFKSFGANAVGVVCDGAGSSHYSEVGSYLAAHYLVNNIIDMMKREMTITDTLNRVYHDLWSNFMSSIVDQIFSDPKSDTEEMNAFVDQTFLHTVVGFIYTPNETYLFLAGDGQFVIDDTVYSFDLSNVQGYHLMGQKQIPYFGIIRLPNGWNRGGIFSDGFEKELMSEIWGDTHPRSLQRKMNVWSDQKHFRDDASAVTIEFFDDAGNRAYINQEPLKVCSAEKTFELFFKPVST